MTRERLVDRYERAARERVHDQSVRLVSCRFDTRTGASIPQFTADSPETRAKLRAHGLETVPDAD